MKDEGEPLSEGLKIGVFGVGATGSVIISFLQQWDAVSQVICIDRNLQRAKEFIKNWNKITLVATDGNGYEKLSCALKGCFLIINAATSALNRWVMKIAWEIGANYLDMASLQNDVAEQKSFHDRFLKKKIAAWINRGIGPGLTNDIAAILIDGFVDCVIKIWVAEHTECDELIFLWNPRLVIDEITSKVPTFSKDPLHANYTREPFSGPEFYTFPEPIGKIICRDMNENEGLTLRDLENIKEVQVKSGGADIEKLTQLSVKIKKYQQRKSLQKFLDSLPQTPTPKQIQDLMRKGILRQGRIAIAVEAKGTKPETKEIICKKATWMGLALSEVPRGTTHISYNTGLVAFCAIQQMVQMARKEELKPGVWAPEQLPKQHREAILKCIVQKSNPVHFEVS